MSKVREGGGVREGRGVREVRSEREEGCQKQSREKLMPVMVIGKPEVSTNKTLAGTCYGGGNGGHNCENKVGA
jgi:hypothetical protein